jgi:hypothetical protein
MTVSRSSLAVRLGVALLLAALIHLSAWQSLLGIRISLAGPEPATPTIEAALLPPAQPTPALPGRRAVVRAARPAGSKVVRPEALTLTAVRSERPSPKVPAVSTREPEAAPKRKAAGSGKPASDDVVATASPSAPTEIAAPPQPAEQAPETVAKPEPSAPSPLPPPAPLPTRAAVQVVLPKSARFVYDSNGTVRVGGFVLRVRGRTTTQWRFEDGRYRSDLSIDVVNFGQSSQGQFDPDFGLAPERYVETRQHHGVHTTRFDWANHRVTFTDTDGQRTAEPGAQDRLSIQFQLSVLRQVYPERFVRGSVVPITLAGTRDVSHWTFTVTGEDSVDSGIGRLSALRVLSNRTTETGDESLEVWISEKLNWFPVRIRIVDKNRNVIDSVLDEATID